MSASEPVKPVKKFTRPRGRQPRGKQWCYMTGVWVEETEASLAAARIHERKRNRISEFDEHGNPKRPKGRSPKGKAWDHNKHKWVPESEVPPRRNRKIRKFPLMKGQKPRGRPPKGKQWDTVAGRWVDQDAELLLPEDLPPGWSAALDDATQKLYYFHQDDPTNPQWEKPALSSATSPSSDLPPGWSTALDEATQKQYYFHQDDPNNPTWERPTLSSLSSSVSAAEALLRYRNSNAADSEPSRAEGANRGGGE